MRTVSGSRGTPPRWAILSAKHGVLDPLRVVAPYELGLKDYTEQERAAWRDRVRGELNSRFVGVREFLVLAGIEYRSALEGLPFHYPMDGLSGMSIGKQLQWLKQHPVWKKP